MFSVVFPGQGSQKLGMAKEFFEKFELVKKLFNEADEILNLPISKIIFEGPESELNLTENNAPIANDTLFYVNETPDNNSLVGELLASRNSNPQSHIYICE